MTPIVVVAVALLIGWVAVAGALAFGLGRAVAVARVREQHAILDSEPRRSLLRVVTTTAGRSSIVRSR